MHLHDISLIRSYINARNEVSLAEGIKINCLSHEFRSLELRINQRGDESKGEF